ncbi:ATP-binding cassette domain-containing protein [Saccharibacillus sp. CPCC 101409]|uniref:ATP-binding cassette domain-containing protein n=1 Tax=Saccharibacillus sp. CPCC 101409 TaxID=3058041 RepID=UPI0026726DDE|nr:ATP-binding cassette domain-containing protein [Saccharibacillus sp. CPCC 101409]MDO3412374.1 ATP-binding cassette domain-containing protein [Saccharibacillus sp. CPCC 101409]
MLRFERVFFHYRKDRPVLRDLSFTIGRGEFVSIVGGNGSGKSTLARLIDGLLQPRGGSVCMNGLDPADPAQVRQVRETAGLVFQNPDDQFITTTVTDEIVFGLENIRVPRSEMGGRIDEALRLVRLEGYADSAPHELSGGQKQRAAIAAVLAMRPKLVVFDEATSMLDPRGRADMMELMRELSRRGMTIVQITHHMEEVMESGRVLLLDQGRIAFDGDPGLFFQKADLERYALDKPFGARVHDKLGLRGAPAADWKKSVKAQWPI